MDRTANVVEDSGVSPGEKLAVEVGSSDSVRVQVDPLISNRFASGVFLRARNGSEMLYFELRLGVDCR